MKITRRELLRFALFIIGLWISGVGVAITKAGALGVSPVSSVANVLSIRFPSLTLGNWLIVWNCLLILGQAVVLGRQFRLYQLLQVPLSFLFGLFTDSGTMLMRYVPVSGYAAQLACVIVGTLVLGLGIAMTVTANVVMNSGEAFVKAIADRFSIVFGRVKTVFDISCVLLSVVLSLLLCGGTVVGTREGTVIAALCTGYAVRLFMGLINRKKASD